MNKFSGFTLPDGAYLPKELLDLLPDLSKSELKVLIVVIYHSTQTGASEPISQRDIQALSGLSIQSVSTGITSLLEKNIITQTRISNTFAYDIQILEHQVKASKIDIELDNTKLSILRDLRTFGVYNKLARTFVSEHDTEYLLRHIDYFKFALHRGYARGPGFLCLSIKEDWGPPLGYSKQFRDNSRYKEWDNI